MRYDVPSCYGPAKWSPRLRKKRINIVSINLSPESKNQLDAVCDQRGMTIKSLLGRLVGWFSERDQTEQAIIMGQVEAADTKALADILLKRSRK